MIAIPTVAPLEPLPCHRAETERLAALSGFLCSMAPAIGEAREGYAGSADADLTEDARDARDAAVLAAFRAVARIADHS